jgi:hypothetical protein
MVALTALDGGNHGGEIRPEPETVCSETTGQLVSLLNPPPGSFPLAAVCITCGEAIRLASRSTLARWHHADP